MSLPKSVVRLTTAERTELEDLMGTGKRAASVILHARILLKADAGANRPGWDDDRIAEAMDGQGVPGSRSGQPAMTTDIESLVPEHLRAIRADLGDVKARITDVEVPLSAMGQQLVGLTTAVYSDRSELDELRRRVERIERRLDLRDMEH